jgi:hypothetical protein
MTKEEILAEALDAFRSGLPEGVALTEDGVEAVEAYYRRHAKRLSTLPRLRERERAKISDKLAQCGRYAAALAESDEVDEIDAAHAEGGIAAGNTINATALCD